MAPAQPPPPSMACTDTAGSTGRGRAARSSVTFCAIFASLLVFCALLSYSANLVYLWEESLRPVLDASRRAPADQTLMVNDKLDHGGAAAGAALRIESAARGEYMPLRVITFNVRFATKRPGSGEQPWRVRSSGVGNQLNFITAGHESPFICFQETLYSQINDIQSHLGDSWSYVGKGRDDGRTRGEFSPIFYRSESWKVERTETRWLSKTPDRPSRGWDAADKRIVTIGEFSHRVTGTRVVVMSTHFDHKGSEARRNSAGLLIRFAEEWSSRADAAAPASAVLIGGDLNSTPDDGAYKIMTAAGSGMSDVSDLVPADKHYGNLLTYTGFSEKGEVPLRIDFLFLREPHTASVRTFGVLANSFDDQILLSDHRPVVADMDILV